MNILNLYKLGLLVVVGLYANHVWAWGKLGHELIAEHGNALVPASFFETCHVKPQQVVDHVNDPDAIWKHDKRRHPDEDQAHFFHIDTQPKDWRLRKQAEDLSQGFLVYRITKWVEDAKVLRTEEKWGELSERLYGLAHYVGDLSMPLHLTKNYDGKEVGLPDLHKQWESTMVMRYYVELEKKVSDELEAEKIPVMWSSIDYSTLIFNIASQSYEKSSYLFTKARDAMELPRHGRHGKRRHKAPVARFIKSKLFESTGDLAARQLTLSSRLWAHTLSQICH